MATFSSVRRRNVSPTSTTLSVQTRDVDCSGMAAAPEDGEFVPQDGEPAAVTYFGVNAAAVAADNTNATSLSMVWGSALRSDRQALGDTRVATLAHGTGIEVECALYELPGVASLDTEAPVGTSLSVIQSTDVIHGAADRLILAPMLVDDVGWSVGYVVSHRDGALFAADDRPIRVFLYDKPRFVGDKL